MPLAAQEPAPTGDAPPPEAPAPDSVSGAQTYTPADFARFAPRNALDMLQNVPGFQIRADNSGNRGLGQASENVIVNGQRLSSKSDDLFQQLERIPAESVVRIEIVDGATLAIPGLSGQAANVVTKPAAFSGQYKLLAEARPYYSHPGYTFFDVSVKGTSGKVEWSAAIQNDINRGGYGGDYVIRNPDLSVREIRTGRLWSDDDTPKVSAGLKYTGPDNSILNLNGSYRRTYGTFSEFETRQPAGGATMLRDLYGRERGWDYEIGGDYQLKLLGGQLKVIGLNRFNHNTFDEREVIGPQSGGPGDGGRYGQVVESGEVVGRGEFSWKWGKADWQIAGEAAFNRLDKDASLFDITGGADTEIPFPQGDGGVRERRYEGSLSYGRPLSSRFTIQATLAGEHSTIFQTGQQGISRSFLRPKGSVSFAWAPEKGLDLSLKVARVVGQLNFGDFLGRVFLNNGNQNGSNFELVPEQAWNVDLAAKKDLKKWGSTNLRFFYRGISDYLDLIPLIGGGESRGNIASARRYGFEWTSTFNLDPLGIKGAKINSNLIMQESSLIDPLTKAARNISGITARYLNVDLRHDIPGSDWAYGGGFEMPFHGPSYRRNEIGTFDEGPVFDFYFVEHKGLMGLNIRAEAINILAGATHNTYRVIYTGDRQASPVALIEDRRQRIGPIFRVVASGKF